MTTIDGEYDGVPCTVTTLTSGTGEASTMAWIALETADTHGYIAMVGTGRSFTAFVHELATRNVELVGGVWLQRNIGVVFLGQWPKDQLKSIIRGLDATSDLGPVGWVNHIDVHLLADPGRVTLDRLPLQPAQMLAEAFAEHQFRATAN